MSRKSALSLVVLAATLGMSVRSQTGFRLVNNTSAGSSSSEQSGETGPARILLSPASSEPTPTPVPAKPKATRAPTSSPIPDAGEAAALALAAHTVQPNLNEAVIRPGMQISVMVYVQGKVEVSIPDQRISESGKISLPLLREIEVAPMSLSAAEKQITTAYGEFFKSPHVIIAYVGNEKDPMMSPWGYVTVMGRVAKQGRVAIPPTRNLTVSSAIQLSGGTASSANDGSIIVFRPQEGGNPKKIQVDLQNMARKGDQGEDVPLFSGDVIYVPERIF